MNPESLRGVPAERPTMVVCIATCQNPTTSVMSEARRKQIVEIAREFDFILVDDDLYGFLARHPSRRWRFSARTHPVSHRLIEIGTIDSTNRLSARPAGWLARLVASVRTSVWMVSLAAQLATLLITSGKRLSSAMLSARSKKRDRCLLGNCLATSSIARYLQAFIFGSSCRRSGQVEISSLPSLSHLLLIAGGNGFSMNRDGEGRQYVRIVLMASTRKQMRFVLTKLNGLLSTPDTLWL